MRPWAKPKRKDKAKAKAVVIEVRRLDLTEDVAREVRESGAVVRERVVERGAGRKEGEKRCTSPFPFLDVASTLILQLSGE